MKICQIQRKRKLKTEANFRRAVSFGFDLRSSDIFTKKLGFKRKKIERNQNKIKKKEIITEAGFSRKANLKFPFNKCESARWIPQVGHGIPVKLKNQQVGSGRW
ncbi:MAG: hypothetical protein N2035_00370 [Chthoniobacterales bacterium]|nr:hypothetical protein [Chthoniobacterales bacterium]